MASCRRHRRAAGQDGIRHHHSAPRTLSMRSLIATRALATATRKKPMRTSPRSCVRPLPRPRLPGSPRATSPAHPSPATTATSSRPAIEAPCARPAAASSLTTPRTRPRRRRHGPSCTGHPGRRRVSRGRPSRSRPTHPMRTRRQDRLRTRLSGRHAGASPRRSRRTRLCYAADSRACSAVRAARRSAGAARSAAGTTPAARAPWRAAGT